MQFWSFGRKWQNLKPANELGDTFQMSPLITNSTTGPKQAEVELLKHKLLPFEARLDLAKMFMLSRLENTMQN